MYASGSEAYDRAWDDNEAPERATEAKKIKIKENKENLKFTK